ncbi:hypothetical protein BTO16_03955 [Polaribacter glomeratus]|uniref:Uncharacterized protein n=2 Tax=Polaribacter glomeratus TaxID=102 RepID=A0A2S7WVZ3_9FLAO|nr:hypothetical protein BTO16_03955 [Polaribacter glomeratus]TXD66500.1 hypothetical protein ESX12_05815 [Polaribacter glomeratus]
MTIIVISACEKDDFCTQNPITPNLVLRFYDTNNRETLKSVERLSIWAENKDTIVSYKSITLDSVAIPLNAIDTKTVYHLKMNTIDGKTANNQEATFTISYTPKEEYVSRSCGFRVQFNDVTFESNNSWIKDFTPKTVTTIANQNAAHVQIFH